MKTREVEFKRLPGVDALLPAGIEVSRNLITWTDDSDLKPTPMMKFQTVAILSISPLILSACCTEAHPRFWQVRDTADGKTAYTVDTVAVPASSLMPVDIRYVDAAGHCVKVVSPKPIRQMSEQEWRAATSGARYSLRYCGIRKNCWAKAKGR